MSGELKKKTIEPLLRFLNSAQNRKLPENYSESDRTKKNRFPDCQKGK